MGGRRAGVLSEGRPGKGNSRGDWLRNKTTRVTEHGEARKKVRMGLLKETCIFLGKINPLNPVAA